MDLFLGRDNTHTVIVLPSSEMGSTLKEKILSFKDRPLLRQYLVRRKSKHEVTVVIRLTEMTAKLLSVSSLPDIVFHFNMPS